MIRCLSMGVAGAQGGGFGLDCLLVSVRPLHVGQVLT